MPVGRVFVDWVVRGDCGRHISPRDADRRYWTVEASAFSYIRRYEREITIAVTILSGHSTVVLLHCAASRVSRGEVAIVTKDLPAAAREGYAPIQCGCLPADASAMPTITSGNTNVPTMRIAERAARAIVGRSFSRMFFRGDSRTITARYLFGHATAFRLAQHYR